MVVFLPDDPSYSPGEGGDGVILYAPFIRAWWVTYKTQNVNIFVFLYIGCIYWKHKKTCERCILKDDLSYSPGDGIGLFSTRPLYTTHIVTIPNPFQIIIVFTEIFLMDIDIRPVTIVEIRQ